MSLSVISVLFISQYYGLRILYQILLHILYNDIFDVKMEAWFNPIWVNPVRNSRDFTTL